MIIATFCGFVNSGNEKLSFFLFFLGSAVVKQSCFCLCMTWTHPLHRVLAGQFDKVSMKVRLMQLHIVFWFGGTKSYQICHFSKLPSVHGLTNLKFCHRCWCHLSYLKDHLVKPLGAFHKLRSHFLAFFDHVRTLVCNS